MRAGIATTFLLAGIVFLLFGCRTRSTVFDALEKFDREAVIRTNSGLADFSRSYFGSGFQKGEHFEWSDWRFRFEIPATNADVAYQVYHDKVQDLLLAHADHVYGGEILSNANFRRFIFDYDVGRRHGNFSAYSFISTNDDMWVVDLLYEH